jgi:hypothetical protein
VVSDEGAVITKGGARHTILGRVRLRFASASAYCDSVHAVRDFVSYFAS